MATFRASRLVLSLTSLGTIFHSLAALKPNELSYLVATDFCDLLLSGAILAIVPWRE